MKCEIWEKENDTSPNYLWTAGLLSGSASICLCVYLAPLGPLLRRMEQKTWQLQEINVKCKIWEKENDTSPNYLWTADLRLHVYLPLCLSGSASVCLCVCLAMRLSGSASCLAPLVPLGRMEQKTWQLRKINVKCENGNYLWTAGLLSGSVSVYLCVCLAHVCLSVWLL